MRLQAKKRKKRKRSLVEIAKRLNHLDSRPQHRRVWLDVSLSCSDIAMPCERHQHAHIRALVRKRSDKSPSATVTARAIYTCSFVEIVHLLSERVRCEPTILIFLRVEQRTTRTLGASLTQANHVSDSLSKTIDTHEV